MHLFKKYSSACRLQLVGWIPISHKHFISNINVQRVAEQVELVSASQGSVVSECNVIPTQKNNTLVL